MTKHRTKNGINPRRPQVQPSVNLKNKWNNLSVSNGQGSQEKSKAPKAKVNLGESSCYSCSQSVDFASIILLGDG